MHADSRNDVGLSLLVGFDAVAEIMTFTLRLTLTERRTLAEGSHFGLVLVPTHWPTLR